MGLKKYPKTLGDLTGYVVYEPEGYDKTKKYPVVFLIHGQGERGDGSEAGLQNLFDFIGNPWNYFMDNLKKNNVILIAPQLPWSLSYWPLNYCTEALKFAGNYSIDPDRKYLMGISLGGHIAWGYPKTDATKGNEFAAIVAICCVGTSAGDFCNIKSPVWAFHGGNDGVVSKANSKAAIDAMKLCGNKEAKYTELANQGHDIWGLVLDHMLEYGESETAWAWMLRHKKAGEIPPVPNPEPPNKTLTQLIRVYSDGSTEVEVVND